MLGDASAFRISAVEFLYGLYAGCNGGGLKRHESEQTRVAVELADGAAAKLSEWADLNPGVTFAEERMNGGVLIFESDDPAVLSERLAKMMADGLPVSGFQRIERRLEDAFCDIVGQLQDGNES